MTIKVILLVFLALAAAHSQNCESFNASEVDPSGFDDRTYAIGNLSEDSPDVLVCQCPPDSVYVENETLCSCSLPNQEFNGQSCSCVSGHILVGSSCVNCPYPCISCAANGSCQACEIGFVLLDLECVAFSSDVEGVDEIDGQIVECPGGCLSCSGGICDECNVGYQLTGSEVCQACQAIRPNCFTCSHICSSCYKGSFINGDDCDACPENCLQCDISACSECKAGFYPFGNACVACEDGCVECSASGCTKCGDGFTLILDQCVECMQGCGLCSPGMITSCLGCAQGYYLDMDTCLSCPSSCSSCSSASACTGCVEGYRLNVDVCVPLCRYPCQTCSTSNPDSCTSCYYGFALTGTQCVEQPLSCNSDSSCTVCPRYYFLDSLNVGTCTACGIPNCFHCGRYGSSSITCNKCGNGYTLNADRECQSCPEECLQCTTPYYCTKCAPGFYMLKVDGSSTGKCLPCSVENGCATCRSSQFSCLSCLEGFRQAGLKCLSQTYVDLRIELDVDPENFYQVINTFKDQIMGMAGITNRRKITIRDIREGSSIVDLSIDAEGSTQASSIQGAVIAGTSGGGSLAGFPVIGAQASVIDANASNDEQEEEENETKGISTGAIVAICVVVVVVIVLAIVLIVRWKTVSEVKDGPENLNLDQNERTNENLNELEKNHAEPIVEVFE